MDRSLGLFVIGLIFGGGIGFVTAAGYGVTFDGHDHGAHADAAATAHAEKNHGMAHDTPREVTTDPAPGLTLALTPDPVSGYNLHVMTTQFEFAPQSAGGADRPGQGHAHVYVDGDKIGRLYGPWMHIAALPKGEITLDVTLTSNDHRVLTKGGTPITASTTATIE